MTVMHLMWWPAWVRKWSIFSSSTTLQIVQSNGVSFLHQRHNARSCNDWLWRESRRSGHGFGCVGFCMQWTWWLSSPERRTARKNWMKTYNFPFQFHTVKRKRSTRTLFITPLSYNHSFGLLWRTPFPNRFEPCFEYMNMNRKRKRQDMKEITWKEMKGKDWK